MSPTLRLLFPFLLLINACGDDKGAKTPAKASQPPSQKSAPEMPRSAAPATARLYFVAPSDGAVLSNPVEVVFGLDGMTVVPAGTDAAASGHHHLIIDAPLPAFDRPIPADANHVHYGTGSTATTLELPPGEHTLQLVLGDYLHIPHQPPVMSDVIRITVE